MVCDYCSTLLRDLSNGINPSQLSSGWIKQPRTYFGGPYEDYYTCIYQHHANVGDLRASGSACEVCRYLSACSKAAQHDAADETKMTFYIVRVDHTLGDFNGILHLRGGEPTHPVSEIEGFHLTLQFYSPIAHPVVDPFVLTFRGTGLGVGLAVGSTTALSLGRSIIRSPQNSEADIDSLVKLIQGWHQDCINHHDSCSNPTTFVPTRLIEVGASDGSVEPRLRETTPQDQGERYIAMSYCWGVQNSQNQNLETTDDNFNDHLNQIPLINFPQVLQHAILVTRRLGIRYIWIDALCIIQRQQLRTDWKAEAGKMAQIYSSSWLTISAASSDRCTQAMLKERDGTEVGIVVGITSSAGETESIGIRRQQRTLANELQRCNISHRGWTFQERTLSCRVLHFTQSQLFWECATDTHHEDGKSESNSRGKVMPGHRHWIHRRHEQFPSPRDQEQRAVEWYNLLEEHSDRKLGFPTDRLPSLAGIAREYRSYFPGEYLAGLWHKQLPANLMWSPEPGIQKGTIPTSIDLSGTPHKLPSWSWAAYNGFVHQDLVRKLVEYLGNGRSFGGFMAFVEHASVNADDEDSAYLGQINKGTITLRGKLQSLRYKTPNLYGDGEDTSVPAPPTHNSYNVGMDRDQNMLRNCWGMAIAKMSGKDLETSEDMKCEFAILLLDKPDLRQMVFERCGTAYVSGERYLKLFEGASEVSIMIQ